MRPRVLAIIGSGETGPRMAKVQRAVIRRLAAGHDDPPRVRAAVVDTPYAFQSNASAISDSLVDFFDRRLGIATALASFRSADDDVLARETAIARIREADLVFSGPGSPSYALRHWTGSAIPGLLTDKLITGGALVFASAAAVTLGVVTVPVYEIYKSGEDPYWLPGLNVLASIGVRAAVIPHFDNAEGGGHDTRYCFLGERRLASLEQQLPDDAYILGVDEHTALVVNLDRERAAVHGRGAVTIRRHEDHRRIESGSDIPLAELQNFSAPQRAHAPATAERHPQATGQETDADRLSDLVRGLLAGEDQPDARAAIVRLGEIAQRVESDQTDLLEPLTELLLDVRQAARARGDWATADGIRDRLHELGIEVTDKAQGTSDFRLKPFGRRT